MGFKGWVEKAHAYGTLVMFKHTIFSLSFGLVSLLLATKGQLLLGKIFFILLALLSARTGANALNRVIDAKIDELNPRTANRQLPSKKMSKKEALLFAAVCFAILFGSVYFINPLCFMLLPAAMFFLWFYSYTKRFTWACHLFLGFTCAMAPVGAWLAVTGSFGGLEPVFGQWGQGIGAFFRGQFVLGGHYAHLGMESFLQALRRQDPIFIPLFLGAANAFWVGGFDIIYGAQDVAFDQEHQIHSIPARFGIGRALSISSILHVGALFFLFLTGWWSPSLGGVYFIGIILVGLLLLLEHLLVSPGHLEHVKLASYGLNEIVGVVFLMFSLIAVYV